MRAFEYASPTRLKDAVALLGTTWGDVEVLAGGSDLLALMKEYVVTPKRVVDIKHITELRGIARTRAGVRIGALVTLHELIDNELVRSAFPGLHAAAAGISSSQIRNRATVGGALCQRPRCWYFRSGYGLLARDAQGRSLARDGDNRYHAIFGNEGPACFVNPSSLAPAFVALGARVVVTGSAGTRTIPVQEFYRVPQRNEERENVLAPNEIVTEVQLPAPASGRHSATYDVRHKRSEDWPLATASVVLSMSGGSIADARIVLGHVAPTPWRSAAAEQVLRGQTLTEQTAARAAEAAVQGARPLSRNAYKIQLTRVAVKRALLAAKGA
jgi:xanthine dehydrogenase YagS FAD-binding subunit